MSEQGRRLSRPLFVVGVGAILVVLSAGAWSWLWPFRTNGENVSYTAWTNIDPGFTDVQIVRIAPGRKHLFAGSRVVGVTGVGPGFGGMAFMADTGHRAPDEVEISWRKWPREGQDWYDSDAVDPVRVKVRSRIPKEILKMAQQAQYQLELSFGIGKETIEFCWRVRDFSPAYGTKILEQGGDSPFCKE